MTQVKHTFPVQVKCKATAVMAQVIHFHPAGYKRAVGSSALATGDQVVIKLYEQVHLDSVR